MNVFIIYDSFFGNTERIAQAIGAAFGVPEKVRRVSDVKLADLAGVQLLIVGSPTRAFRPSPATTAFLKSIPKGGLQGVKVAAFDTRADLRDVHSALLTAFVKLLGYAAEPIAGRLKKKGGQLVAAPEGFFIKDTEGPLKDGELERAAAWGASLAA